MRSEQMHLGDRKWYILKNYFFIMTFWVGNDQKGDIF